MLKHTPGLIRSVIKWLQSPWAEHYRNGNPPSFPYSRLLKRPVCKGQERADILESPNYESPTTLETMLNLKGKVQPWQELPERILR